MILQYIFAAVSAFIPIFSIIRQGSPVGDWTRSLAAPLIPKYLPPSQHVRSLPSGFSNLAHGIDTSLLASHYDSTHETDLPPFVHVVLSLWSALVPAPTDHPSLASLSESLPTLVWLILSFLGASILASSYKRSGHPTESTKRTPTHVYVSRVIKSLQLVDDLGHSDLQPGSAVLSPLPVLVSMPGFLPSNTTNRPSTIFPTFELGAERTLQEFIEDSVLSDYVLVDAPPLDLLGQGGGDNSGILPLASPAIAAPDPTQIPLPPSPILLPNPVSLDLATLQDMTLLGDFTDLKPERLLDVQLSEIGFVELSTSNDTLVSSYSSANDLSLALTSSGGFEASTPLSVAEAMTLETSEISFLPSLGTFDIDLSDDDDDIFFTPCLPACDFPVVNDDQGLSPSPSTLSVAETLEHVFRRGAFATDVAEFCFGAGGSQPTEAILEPPAPAGEWLDRDQALPSISRLASISMKDLFSSLRRALGTQSTSTLSRSSSSTSSIAELATSESGDFVLICTPDIEENACEVPACAIRSDLGTGPDTYSQLVSNVLGEPISDQDWLLVNIYLNEEGKYVFVPPENNGEQTTPDSDVHEADNALELQLPSRGSSIRHHFRSGSEDFQQQANNALVPSRRFTISCPNQELQVLSMRLGLVLHEQNFHLFEPFAEMRVAIQGERAAMALAAIPHVRTLRPPRLNYGLTRSEFLNIYADYQSPAAGFSYADRLRQNLPKTRSPVVYSNPPAVLATEGAPTVTPPDTQMIICVNRNRGGQQAHIEHLNPVRIVRQSARQVCDGPTRRTRSQTVSAARTSGSTSEVNTRTASSLLRQVPRLSIRVPAPLADPARDRVAGACRAQPARVPEGDTRSQPQATSSHLVEERHVASIERQARRGRRTTEAVSQPPPLETIIGSPPDSPTRAGQSRSKRLFSSLNGTAAEDLGYAISVPGSSSYPDLPEDLPAKKSKLSFARIDDEGAMNDVPERFVETLRRQTCSTGGDFAPDLRRSQRRRQPWRP